MLLSLDSAPTGHQTPSAQEALRQLFIERYQMARTVCLATRAMGHVASASFRGRRCTAPSLSECSLDFCVAFGPACSLDGNAFQLVPSTPLGQQGPNKVCLEEQPHTTFQALVHPCLSLITSHVNFFPVVYIPPCTFKRRTCAWAPCPRTPM